jgi:hypothetical protein
MMKIEPFGSRPPSVGKARLDRYLLLLKKLDLDQIAFFDHTTILAS